VRRLLTSALGVASYVASLATMVAFAPFLADVVLPRTVDSGPATATGTALAVDLALLTGFAVLHSALARESARAALERRLPAGTPRAVYCLIAALQMLALMAFWRPLPAAVWRVAHPAGRGAIWALFALGCAVVVAGFLALDGERLFGLAQARAAGADRADVAAPLQIRGLYRFVRHPLYSGTVLTLWATPVMTAGHLLLAAVFTAYVLVGARFEERDLLRVHGESFRAYRDLVPGFVPSPARWLRRDLPSLHRPTANLPGRSA
jgi:protein-S-isoprenylcysteine O-methyltransferase Ste14